LWGCNPLLPLCEDQLSGFRRFEGIFHKNSRESDWGLKKGSVGWASAAAAGDPGWLCWWAMLFVGIQIKIWISYLYVFMIVFFKCSTDQLWSIVDCKT
jgi:hypothetical protein